MFLGGDFGGTVFSEKIAAEIDLEVRQIVEKAYKEVRTLLTSKKDKLIKLAAMLLEKEVVEGDELELLLNDSNGHKKRPSKKSVAGE